MLAAKAAGMLCVITKSSYTQDEDFTEANGVYDCIGEGDSKQFELKDLKELFASVTV